MGKLLQSKDDEKNSLIEHLKETHKDLKVMLQSKDAEKIL
jgi:hypothetical protein